MPGVDAAAGTLAVPVWSAGATGGAISARAGGIALITSLFSLIPAVVLGAWLYVQQRDVSDPRVGTMVDEGGRHPLGRDVRPVRRDRQRVMHRS